MYPMLAGVPSTMASASSTAAAPVWRAAEPTTSTSLRAGSLAPVMTASYNECSAGDEVWWTTSSLSTLPADHIAGMRPGGTGHTDRRRHRTHLGALRSVSGRRQRGRHRTDNLQ